ncbi:MAG TPA: hypothetical protein VNH11_27830 [Pirellulales bacterium]|nr:hypothetical protein [Pirellulales bacterium]
MSDAIQDRDRDEGERRKQAALDSLAERREVDVLRGRRALLRRLLDVGTATADDVRDAVTLPRAINPKLFGSVPLVLVKAGVIEHDGFAVTCRPQAHARPISRWRLSDRGKAERWLLANPDRDDDCQDGDQGLLFPIKPKPKTPNNEPGATVAAVAPGMEDSQWLVNL